MQDTLLVAIPIILSIELTLHSLKLVIIQANGISYELRKFIRIWTDNELFIELTKNGYMPKNTLVRHYFGDYNSLKEESRGGVKEIITKEISSDCYEIKELYKLRNGNYIVNKEEISIAKLKARLNGLKSKINIKFENESLNKKIDFVQEVIRRIEETESADRQGLILEV